MELGKSMVIAEQFQEFTDQTVGGDGTLDVGFTLKKPEWYNKHPATLPYKMFVAEVLKKTKDADNKDMLQLVQTQYNTNEMLPFTIIRNGDNQIGIKILGDGAAADNESLKQYKQQYLHANDALFVVREEAKKLDVQPSPTIVHFEDIEVVSKKDCFCNRDFMVDDVKKMLLTVHGATKLWKLGKISEADRSFEKLTFELNAMFRKYDINRCMQKICFLAQVDAETGFFQESEEAAGNDASSQSVYKGRGIIQLTGARNEGEKLYNHPGSYQTYADYVGNQDIVSTPSLIATNLHYCVDSAGWEWAIGNTIPEWNASASDHSPKADALRWKHDYFSKVLGKPLNYAAKLAEIAADEEKYFFLVSKRLNGYPPLQKLEPPHGWPARKAAFYILRNDFFEYDERHNGIAQGDVNDILNNLHFKYLKIAGSYIGIKEGENPVIANFFKDIGHINKNGESLYQDNTSWCAAFANYCLKNGNPEINRKDALNALSFSYSGYEEVSTPFYGSFMVRSDNGTFYEEGSQGHVSMVVGKVGDSFAQLGGNQAVPGEKNGTTVNIVLRGRQKNVKYFHPPGVPKVPLGKPLFKPAESSRGKDTKNSDK